jgi:glycosyltransferase involved in cell wall biosynthesis
LNFYKERGFFRNSKKFVLPNPVDLADFAPVPTDSKRVGFKFLFVGHFEWHKGPLFLVDIFRSLDREYFTRGVQLYLVGSGSLLPRLKEMVRHAPEIVIRGAVWGEAYKRIFQEIDLVVVPSLCYENSPTIIYEALASGIPVIVSRIGGAAELIEEGKNGFTFEAGQRDDLERLLKYVLENRDLVRKMRSYCLESVRDHDVDQYVTELLGLIRL